MAEGIIEKSLRHIKEGDFDTDTLLSGGRQLLGRINTLRESQGVTIKGPSVFSDYGGVPDFTIADYKVEMQGIFPGVYHPAVAVRVYDYPVQSSVNLIVTEPGRYVDTNHTLWLDLKAFAFFTGPTHNELNSTLPEGLPNNGFYCAGVEESVPFRGLKPGDRKGAFGFDNDGKLHLLDDEEKAVVIESDFFGFRALIGCSFYFDMGDGWDHSRFNYDDDSKSQFSYLLKYVLGDGTERTCFAVTPSVLSLRTFREVVEDYMRYVDAKSYRAVELEYTNASAGVRSPIGNRVEHYGSGSFEKRRDHYTIRV